MVVESHIYGTIAESLTINLNNLEGTSGNVKRLSIT